MRKSYIKISKFLSYILRHHPERVGIELDEEGFTDLEVVLNILNKKFQNLNLPEITKDTIEDIIKQSDKLRFEIVSDKIRAFYGHSIDVKITMKEADPLPPKLYHGTNEKAYEQIKTEGLTKRGRQYVHLSKDIKTAILVGKRRTKNPIILEIDTIAANKEGIIFYMSGDMFLTEYIPSEFILKINN